MKNYFISTKIDGFNCFIDRIIETEVSYYIIFEDNRYRDDFVIKFFLRNMQDIENFDILICEKMIVILKKFITIKEEK